MCREAGVGFNVVPDCINGLLVSDLYDTFDRFQNVVLPFATVTCSIS